MGEDCYTWTPAGLNERRMDTKTLDTDVIRRVVALRNPFSVDSLPFLSRLHSVAFLPRRRSSKRFVGKPAKRLFKLLMAAGMRGEGRFRIEVDGKPRSVRFNARNTQFGAVYQPQCQPVYEPETSALLDVLAAKDGVFYDIGANWGWYSLLVASRPGFSGSVHAFEPYPPTFIDLASVVEQAGLSGRVTCHDVALADVEGTASMAFSDGIQSGLARLGEQGGACPSGWRRWTRWACRRPTPSRLTPRTTRSRCCAVPPASWPRRGPSWCSRTGCTPTGRPSPSNRSI
jgi:hypothetical protein